MVGDLATLRNGTMGGDEAWALLLALRRVSAAGRGPRGLAGLSLGADGSLRVLPEGDATARITIDGSAGWSSAGAVAEAARRLLDLYLPLCLAGPGAPLAVAHLGQSLDGQIATVEGESHYVTGPENIVHLHRMRALCDAVVVGAKTVLHDDPRLTTRLVEGPSPLRVVIDPDLRLTRDGRMFVDGEAPSLVACRDDAREPGGARNGSPVEIMRLPASGRMLDPGALLAGLNGRGCWLVFVEGGGETVSRFLEAGVVDRLQVAVAPVVVGRGRPGLSVSPRPLAAALRPRSRMFPMGDDVLFDCELRSGSQRLR